MKIAEIVTQKLNSKEVRKIEKIVDRIESYDEEMQSLSDEDLKFKTQEFKDRLNTGETLDDILPEAFAVCREGAYRALGQKPFRVQLIGGVVMHQGRIAEMKTGEGKTLAATLPAYLNALEGKGIHVVTVNDYLAERDAEWMGKLYSFLGLTVGCVINAIEGEERRTQYLADITYGTNNEFGFDYLRDNMAVSVDAITQRELNFAIVDEVDSILIDEARTPLIIAGMGISSSKMYKQADRFVRSLKPERDYKLDKKEKQIALTDQGVSLCEKHFGVSNLSDMENIELLHYVNQALRANYVMHRDVDYVVADGEVFIVDEFTGRIMYGRRFSNGLHQAIEAKERVNIQAESKTYATITLQNYFRMYKKLSGMTGTAKTEEAEFRDIYNMDVVVVPTNKPVIRKDDEDLVFINKKEKYDAIVDLIADVHSSGQPVLVGTVSIEISEIISNKLKKRGIKHNVLNAKFHKREAEIVAEAGRLGAVTIATNMAGRGTDIILGGNIEFEIKKAMLGAGFSDEEITYATSRKRIENPEMSKALEYYSEHYKIIEDERMKEQKAVVALGGLFIIGTEKHESRRIDNQLRGRSGRQGDPGETRFLTSLEDDIIRKFEAEKAERIIYGYNQGSGLPNNEKLMNLADSAQLKVEDQNFYIRKYILQYDNVKNKQREIIYNQRRMALEGDDLKDSILDMVHDVVTDVVNSTVSESKFPEEWDLETMNETLEQISKQYRGRLIYDKEEQASLDPKQLNYNVTNVFDELYDEKESELGKNFMREIERMALLKTIDNHWVEHIDAMEQLEEGIGLRGIGQQNPADAYAQEGFEMFEEMINDIKKETISICYNAGLRH